MEQLGKKMSVWSLAVVSVIACIVIMGTEGQNKIQQCCTKTSSENITTTITGFQLQRKNPPCVKAVIFFTSAGPVCSHWREKWVFDKIRELKKLQELEQSMNQNNSSVTFTPPSSTTSSTSTNHSLY